MLFEVSAEEESDLIILRLRGPLDHEADEFPAEVRRAALSAKPIVVDLGEVTTVQSMGIGMLVEGFKVAQGAGRRIVFVGARPQVRAVLVHTKLDTVFEILPTVADAFALLRS